MKPRKALASTLATVRHLLGFWPARRGLSHEASHTGICGALEAVTRALAIELAPVRVNLVCAGIVRTELWRNMTEPDRNGLFEKAGQALPVGRVGEPEDSCAKLSLSHARTLQ